ncbi:MAG: nucleotidyltransferase family protein [Acutalibacteraceae bacterium]
MNKSADKNSQESFVYLLNLIKAVLNNKTAHFIKNADWQAVLTISKNHSVENLLYYAVCSFSDEQKSDIEPKVLQELSGCHSVAVVKESNQQYYTDRIISDFEKNHIRNMPLKGYFLKNNYPSPDMRAMSDIDILFDISDYPSVKKILTADHKMTVDNEYDTTFSYLIAPYFHLEMHSSLIDKTIRSDYLENAFDRAVLRNGFGCSYKMTDEDAYIYMVYHTAGHCLDSGIGIKMIMDFYVFIKAFGEKLDWEYVKARLKEAELFDFEECIKTLSFEWFSADNAVTELDNIGQFVLLSGAYGRFDVSMLSQALQDMNKSKEKNKKSNGVTFFLKNIFPPYRKMTMIYPIVKKLPFLYPFSWVYRWIQRLIEDKDNAIGKARLSLRYVDEDEKNYYQNTMKEMGLYK